MGVKPSVPLLMLLAACGFHPSGGRGGDEDAPPTVADGPPGGDGADIDAPALDAAAIDARELDARVIDAPPVDAPAPCPIQYNVDRPSGRYRYVPIAAQHMLAAADCNDDLPGRTHLATFEDAASFDADIAAIDPGNNAIVYIGGVCAPPPADCAMTSNWTWIGGAAIAPLLWGDGQPDNGITERVLATARPMSTWVLDNRSASDTRPYICECDP